MKSVVALAALCVLFSTVHGYSWVFYDKTDEDEQCDIEPTLVVLADMSCHDVVSADDPDAGSFALNEGDGEIGVFYAWFGQTGCPGESDIEMPFEWDDEACERFGDDATIDDISVFTFTPRSSE